MLSFHPDPKKELKHNHPFIKYISIACTNAHISEEVFKKWCCEVQTGFYTRNIVALDCTLVKDAKIKNGQLIGKVRIAPRGFKDVSLKATWFSSSPLLSCKVAVVARKKQTL